MPFGLAKISLSWFLVFVFESSYRNAYVSLMLSLYRMFSPSYFLWFKLKWSERNIRPSSISINSSCFIHFLEKKNPPVNGQHDERRAGWLAVLIPDSNFEILRLPCDSSCRLGRWAFSGKRRTVQRTCSRDRHDCSPSNSKWFSSTDQIANFGKLRFSAWNSAQVEILPHNPISNTTKLGGPWPIGVHMMRWKRPHQACLSKAITHKSSNKGNLRPLEGFGSFLLIARVVQGQAIIRRLHSEYRLASPDGYENSTWSICS